MNINYNKKVDEVKKEDVVRGHTFSVLLFVKHI